MKKLIHDIHRRSLWQVLGIYLVGSWVALQVVDVLANNFGLPEWFPAFALALLVIGLPIVLATAFVQEGSAPSAEGDSGSAPSQSEEVPSSASSFFTWRNALAGGAAAFALLGMLTAGWWIFGGEPTPEPSIAEANAALAPDLRSVAVLPFATRSSVEEDQFFADGMHDDLLTQLSKIDSLTVISRTSVEKYRDGELGIPEIATELGVATVVEGGIQRSGDRVRVNVQLIEASTDRHLWAETYDEELTAANVFSIQSDLATEIAGALRATLTPEVVARLNAQPTESLEAFDLFTRGRYIYERAALASPQRLVEVLGLFEQAVEADPAFAPAWAGIADVYAFGSTRGVFTPEEAAPKAWDAIETALELDPDLAVALSRRGLLHMSAGRQAEAEQDFARALALNPGSAVINRRYGALLDSQGRPDEALDISRRTVQLDPLDIANRQTLEDRLWAVEAFEEAAEISRGTLQMDSNLTSSWYNLGWVLGMLGQNDEAVEAFAHASEQQPDNQQYAVGLAWGHARAGNREQAIELAQALEADGFNAYDVSLVYFELGDTDRAYEHFARSLADNATQLQGLPADPSAAEFRADPRYQEILDRLGLTEG